MIESLIQNLNQDIALLQRRIELDKKAGFNNMARLLESLSIQLFKAIGLADLQSKNQITMNFPAIDSADDAKGIALQVTSVANARKIKDTIAKFEAKDANGRSLKDEYPTLYIFGFCNVSTGTAATQRDYCHVIGPDFFINRLIDLGDEGKVQSVIDAVRHHVDYSSLHPYSDIGCLTIMLGYIGRNAIRHRMSCEGSIAKMTTGLDEISELIGKGSVHGKTKSKALHQFEDQEIPRFLREVLSDIGAIKAIVNKGIQAGGFVCLTSQEMAAIDKRKTAITEAAESIAKVYGIELSLAMHDGIS